MNFKDLTGKKFGKLLVLSFSHWKLRKNEKKHRPIWNCLCDCGKTIKTNLNGHRTKSCGCLKKENAHKLPKGVSSMNNLLSIYKSHAKERNLNWELTVNDFNILTSKNCVYCDMEPRQITQRTTFNGLYVYNGIDRVDNNLRIYVK